MTDCPNAEMRDRLPDLLHERLDASARAVVLAHVEACADCRGELALLRDLRGVMAAATPRVDVTAIVIRLPRPATVGRPDVVPIASRRRSIRASMRSWGDRRVAAAVTLLLAGGTTAVLSNRGHTGLAGSASMGAFAAPSVAPVGTESAAVPTAAVASHAAQHDLPVNGQLAELSDADLRALLDDIGRIDATTPADPDPSTSVDPATAPEE